MHKKIVKPEIFKESNTMLSLILTKDIKLFVIDIDKSIAEYGHYTFKEVEIDEKLNVKKISDCAYGIHPYYVNAIIFGAYSCSKNEVEIKSWLDRYFSAFLFKTRKSPA